jgi:hypothetical protein
MQPWKLSLVGRMNPVFAILSFGNEGDGGNPELLKKASINLQRFQVPMSMNVR